MHDFSINYEKVDHKTLVEMVVKLYKIMGIQDDQIKELERQTKELRSMLVFRTGNKKVGGL
jgi:hypothetical protein